MPETERRSIRHAVILAHPDEHSFNASVAKAYCETVREHGQEYILRDLYRIGFDPVLKDHERPGGPGLRISADTLAEIEMLRDSDMFTFIYPVWFGMPPAMMKGYVDRVIGAGVTASEVQAHKGPGPLSGRHMFCITTSGAPEKWLDEQGQMEALRELSSRYLFRAFAMKSAETLHIGGIVKGLPQASADKHLRDVRERTRRICLMLSSEQFGTAGDPSIWDGS